ncbi:MAG: hypothetical protein AVDCRST_MAG33-3346 [uncultured Thermomicrobiales bacterium]|uniref:Uncharacterized protein n=1 Tax=uncultured Thermomicrobiales bacterium TaxID=1645740 RepID=A0A6J4VHE2_9BACT|nr:MAG: hypothetical protein AVDCRST_MAG33-3346 [uncultured Thermomicrobiales bacterium]
MGRVRVILTSVARRSRADVRPVADVREPECPIVLSPDDPAPPDQALGHAVAPLPLAQDRAGASRPGRRPV